MRALKHIIVYKLLDQQHPLRIAEFSRLKPVDVYSACYSVCIPRYGVIP